MAPRFPAGSCQFGGQLGKVNGFRVKPSQSNGAANQAQSMQYRPQAVPQNFSISRAKVPTVTVVPQPCADKNIFALHAIDTNVALDAHICFLSFFSSNFL